MTSNVSVHLTGRIAAAFTALALLGVPMIAAASPASEITAAREQAQEARRKLDDLAADLEERSEEYLVIEAEVEKTRGQIRVAEDELAIAIAEVEASEARLNMRATAIYRTGGVNLVSVMLGVTDFRDFVNRLELMRRVGMSDASIVAAVKQARNTAEKTEAELESRKSEQMSLLKVASRKKTEVDRALAAQEKYLAGIDSKLNRLIAEERERQARIARERARQAAAATAASRHPSSRAFDEASLPSPRPQALAVARRYVGVTPYVWGGTTPAGFDCSGLVLYSYREIGVNLPRTSRMQFTVGAYIPPERLDLLAPGDLVFFGRDGDPGRVHHVAIYSGNGNMVHAPQTGMLVSESSLLARIATRGDYVGATRP